MGKLWGGMFSGKLDPFFEDFNRSLSFDRRLALEQRPADGNVRDDDEGVRPERRRDLVPDHTRRRLQEYESSLVTNDKNVINLMGQWTNC